MKPILLSWTSGPFEFCHILHEFNPSNETIYIIIKTCKFTRKDIHIYVCPAFASSHCIESSISSHLQFDLYIQQYNDLEGNYFREIAEEGFLWEAETCMWRRVLMRTMRTWSTTWRTTSTGRGWPPARLTRRLRCGTSRTAGSGCALLGVTF